MPIETEHHIPWSRERYRFRPWYERALTVIQVRVVLVAFWSVAAVLVVLGGIAVWLVGGTAGVTRCLACTLTTAFLTVLAVAGRDVWLDLRGPSDR